MNSARLQRLARFLKWKRVGYHASNPACCDILHQNRRESDHSTLSNANAIASQNPYTRNKPFVNIVEGRNNDSEQKYYLCDYHYKGEAWCIEIPAESWEDAEARLKRLSYGKVVGEIKMTLPIHIGWLAKLKRWINKAIKL